jgi:hypothetical protein
VNRGEKLHIDTYRSFPIRSPEEVGKFGPRSTTPGLALPFGQSSPLRGIADQHDQRLLRIHRSPKSPQKPT